MRATIRIALVTVLTLPLTVPSAAASTPFPQPEGDIRNVRLVGNIPTDTQATAINFLTYGQGRDQRDVMVTVGRFGVRAYDLADPASPELLSEVSSDGLRLTGDVTGTFWQNEDMAVDERRKLVFLARDPRAYGGTTSDPDDAAGVYIVDASDPDAMFLRSFVEVGAGHTATCVNDCDYLWVGGPASNTAQQAAWPRGRPILVVDVRDPDAPVVFPDAVDLHRDDGVTAYAHDVQVDAAGVAWVSGLGGVRGYHTDGMRWDPVEQVRRRATAWDPVPFAGGRFADEGAPTAFMHNSLRAVRSTAKDGPRSNHGHRADELIMATEEQFSQTDCSSQGIFSIASLRGSYDGEGWRSTPDEPFRLEVVGTWSPFEQEGYVADPVFCSAHYFQMQDRVLTYSWYSQGTRFLDVSDPTDPIQIAYYRPDVTNSWASYFHGDHIYVADHARGIDILELTVDARRAAEARREVVAPPMSPTQVANSRAIAAQYRPDPDLGWACPVPRRD